MLMTHQTQGIYSPKMRPNGIEWNEIIMRW